jgi:hypothetical protein
MTGYRVAAVTGVVFFAVPSDTRRSGRAGRQMPDSTLLPEHCHDRSPGNIVSDNILTPLALTSPLRN